MIQVTKSPKETEKLAGFLLAKITKNKSKKALVVALEGELGAGKTTFTKGLAKSLGIKTKIKSPTFNLIKNYSVNSKILYHIDCYRLKNYRDLLPLGIKEIISNPQNIVIIEWSDRVREILPKKYIKIHIDHMNKNTRKITIK